MTHRPMDITPTYCLSFAVEALEKERFQSFWGWFALLAYSTTREWLRR